MPEDGKKRPVEVDRRMEARELLSKSEVSLWLDTYEDVFSDFDPRPYDHRALSDDFLQEAKRATREISDEKLELRFLMPAHQRDYSLENVIRHRLHEHFRKHARILEKEMKKVFIKAVLFLMIGFSLMIASALMQGHSASDFAFSLVRIIMEPSGWFMMWYGFDQVFYSSKEIKPDLTFNEKMAKAEITFDSY
ncbi:MAG: hypothetical protein QXO69_03520 [archaeon]